MPAFRRIEFKHRLQYSETTVLKEQEKIKGGRGIERKWEMEKKEKEKKGTKREERGERIHTQYSKCKGRPENLLKKKVLSVDAG